MKRGKKNASLHETVLDSSAKIPEIALSSVLSKKFEDAGIIDFPRAARAAARHLLAGRRFEDFEWDDDADVTIHFTEEDMHELERKVGSAIETLPEVTRKIIEHVSKGILDRHQNEWASFRRHEERGLSAFRINLEERWGLALDNLRVLHSISLSEGESFAQRLAHSKAKTGKLAREVVIKLHIRGCQVVAEIITLLENGFADGAMARWRTLHEITTVADIIANSTDGTAARYLEHEAIDAKRAMDTYLRVHMQLGYKAPSKREIAHIEATFREALVKYGESFATPLGWASEIVRKKAPRFSDLEEISGRTAMRSHYKLASYDVHASSRALTHRIGLLDKSVGPVAGATNAGLEEAGQNTAFTFAQLTWLVLKRGRRLDEAVIQKMFVDLRDKTATAFADAADQLQRDDREVRAALEEQFGPDAPHFEWG